MRTDRFPTEGCDQNTWLDWLETSINNGFVTGQSTMPWHISLMLIMNCFHYKEVKHKTSMFHCNLDYTASYQAPEFMHAMVTQNFSILFWYGWSWKILFSCHIRVNFFIQQWGFSCLKLSETLLTMFLQNDGWSKTIPEFNIPVIPLSDTSLVFIRTRQQI